MKRGWSAHEQWVNEVLDLCPTVHSGNRWHDIGDGTDRTHSHTNPFALISDCKYTEARSKSIKLSELQEWWDKATEMGKRFIMPLRFWPKDTPEPHDYVLLSLNDFAELLSHANFERRLQQTQEARRVVDRTFLESLEYWGRG